jgi:hypothetical protein
MASEEGTTALRRNNGNRNAKLAYAKEHSCEGNRKVLTQSLAKMVRIERQTLFLRSLFATGEELSFDTIIVI